LLHKSKKIRKLQQPTSQRYLLITTEQQSNLISASLSTALWVYWVLYCQS